LDLDEDIRSKVLYVGNCCRISKRGMSLFREEGDKVAGLGLSANRLGIGMTPIDHNPVVLLKPFRPHLAG